MKGNSIQSFGNAEQVAAAEGSIATSHVISMPWGPDRTLELTIPDIGLFRQADLNVVWPDLSDPLVDYSQSLQQALDSPLGTAKLEQHVGPGAG